MDVTVSSLDSMSHNALKREDSHDHSCSLVTEHFLSSISATPVTLKADVRTLHDRINIGT